MKQILELEIKDMQWRTCGLLYKHATSPVNSQESAMVDERVNAEMEPH